MKIETEGNAMPHGWIEPVNLEPGVSLSMWSKGHIDTKDLAEFDAWAKDLGLIIHCNRLDDAPTWLLTFGGEGAQVFDSDGERFVGSLAKLLNGALNRAEKYLGRNAWTSEEIAQIAAQSGLDVTHA